MSETKVPGLNVRITSKSQLDNIKKVAITKPGQQALFLELDQVVPITDTLLLHWFNGSFIDNFTSLQRSPLMLLQSYPMYWAIIICRPKIHHLLKKVPCLNALEYNSNYCQGFNSVSKTDIFIFIESSFGWYHSGYLWKVSASVKTFRFVNISKQSLNYTGNRHCYILHARNYFIDSNVK